MYFLASNLCEIDFHHLFLKINKVNRIQNFFRRLISHIHQPNCGLPLKCMNNWLLISFLFYCTIKWLDWGCMRPCLPFITSIMAACHSLICLAIVSKCSVYQEYIKNSRNNTNTYTKPVLSIEKGLLVSFKMKSVLLCEILLEQDCFFTLSSNTFSWPFSF